MPARKDDLEKAYFGVVRFEPNSGEFETFNLFDSIRVQTSVAAWRVMDESPSGRKNKKWLLDNNHDPLMYCFSDVRGRVEYEMWCQGAFDETTHKTDVYQMFVEPNRELLMNMVENMSISSCRRVLRKYKRPRK